MTVANRGGATDYRGLVAIHSAHDYDDPGFEAVDRLVGLVVPAAWPHPMDVRGAGKSPLFRAFSLRLCS